MSNPSTIELLPEHLIDQIKAGEVIERPSSLLKELVENSVDAGARHIDIQIKNQGIDLISVIDDGQGMGFHDLPLAFTRHATSKLSRFEDLYSLHSYGFRGEALASAASIARLECTSARADGEGGKIVIHGAQTITHSQYSSPKHGTSILVKDLFYNTPVRLGFLKSATSELNAIKKIFFSFLLSNPQISFSFKVDEKEKIFYPAVDELKMRVQQIFFGKSKDSSRIIHFKKEYEGHLIEAFIAEEGSKGAARKKHFLTVNQRFFYDKVFHQTLVRKMQNVWGLGNYGHYYLKMSVPPQLIDVNVHPNKLEVKLAHSSIITSLISSGLDEAVAVEAKPNFSSSSFQEQAPLESHPSPSFENRQQETPPSFSKEDTIQKSDYLSLGSRFYLSMTEQKIFDLSFFVKKKISSLFEYPCSEENIVPLLVGEPFYFDSNFDHYIPELYRYGLQIERIKEDMLLLRTIPGLMKSYRPLQLLKDFFFFLAKDQNKDIHQSLGSFLKNGDLSSDQSFTQAQLYELFGNRDQSSQAGFRNFREEEIKKLFTSS